MVKWGYTDQTYELADTRLGTYNEGVPHPYLRARITREQILGYTRLLHHYFRTREEHNYTT